MNTTPDDSRDPIQGYSPAGQLLNLITAYWTSQAIGVAAELGIADLLGRRGRPVADLARETGTDAGVLYRLLRALESSGVFAEVAPRQFALTPMGALLKRDMPGNLRDFARLQTAAWHWQAWGRLIDSVRSGDTADLDGASRNCFDFLAGRPGAAALFNAAMTGYTSRVHASVIECYDFSDARVVLDAGGGEGALLAGVLEANPHLRGILFDREAVLAGAPRILDEYGVGARTERVAGDFFAGLPRGADVILLCAVLHDWDDARAIALLRQVAAALPPRGRALIVENIIPEDGADHPAKRIDLEMLLMTGGRERTLAEFSTLLDAAGLRTGRVLPTAVSVSVIEALPSHDG